MPDILIAHRLMLPPRDQVFVLCLGLVTIALVELERARARITRYQTLTQCRTDRRNRSA